MLFDTMPDIVPRQVTPVAGKGALGTWQPREWSGARTQCRGNADFLQRGYGTSKPAVFGVYARQRLSHAPRGKARGGGLGSEPDSGKPTVRDRRGALGNVAMVEL
jgi:hypothetical protein